MHSSGVPKTFYRVAFPDPLCHPILKGGGMKPGSKTIIRVPLNDEDIEKETKKEPKEAKEKEAPTENRIKEDMYLAMLTKEEKEGKLGWESVSIVISPWKGCSRKHS